MLNAQDAQGGDDSAEVFVGEQVLAQDGEVECDGLPTVLGVEVGDGIQFTFQHFLQPLLVPLFEQDVQRLAESGEVLDGELCHPLGSAGQALSPCLLGKFCFGVLEHLCQLAAQFSRAARCFYGLDDEAGYAGAWNSQLAQRSSKTSTICPIF
ncbi:MAG: hypothetical protein ACUVTG_14785 [Candidatus Oleimicrobiaceae bacterium]